MFISNDDCQHVSNHQTYSVTAAVYTESGGKDNTGDEIEEGSKTIHSTQNHGLRERLYECGCHSIENDNHWENGNKHGPVHTRVAEKLVIYGRGDESEGNEDAEELENPQS